uniref:Obg domain-containing protein n=1 Tax=Oryza punctata TaxID=4537 RepID=A0A0E0MID4_ORYPU
MWRRQHALLRRISPLKPPAAWPATGIGCYYATEPEGRKPKTAPLQSRGMVDRFRLRAKGGDGGNGCISLRRSRSDRQGKPDGGNGGRGGDVILECSRSVWDFSGLQHHMKASRGANGVSKNQIGTRGSDKIAQVPVGTVIHLVEGEQPSLTVDKPTRALDPWDIPDAVEHSPFSSSRIGSKIMKDYDGTSYPQQVEVDENDQSDDEDDEFWEDDEDELDMEEVAEEKREEEEVRYSVAEMTKPGQRLIIARGGEGGLGNACILKEMWLSKAHKQEEMASLSTGQPGTEEHC